MKRVNLCLSDIQRDWQRYGIGQYEYHVVSGLAACGKYDLRGTMFRSRSVEVPFPVFNHVLPHRYFFLNPMIAALCPIPYNWACGDLRSEIFVFFANYIPRLPVRGKVIAVVHDLIPLYIRDCLLREGASAAQVDRMRGDFERTVKRADVLCVVSEYTKREVVEEYGVDPAKIRIVPPGVDAESFVRGSHDELDSMVRAKYSLPERFFLYFGNLREYKNVDGALRAYSRLPEEIRSAVPFVVNGEPNARLGKVVDECGIGKDVRFLGFVPDEEKASLYRLATVFVFLSLIEGFGMPVLEAMAAGTPVLCSNRASLPEVAGDGALLVNPLDCDAIAVGMRRLLDDDGLREKLAAEGHTRAGLFSWKNSIDRMIAAIDELA